MYILGAACKEVKEREGKAGREKPWNIQQSVRPELLMASRERCRRKMSSLGYLYEGDIVSARVSWFQLCAAPARSAHAGQDVWIRTRSF